MFKVDKIYKTSRNDIAMNIRFPEEIYNINAMNYALENMEEKK